ncbi:head GIN domain-containing protein [Sphingomonas sp. BIUV-7]|uniref:Head GIN domain-containing protein n=1 Tax=Sphingomonas natans TaxID=3063330 RepID=A0ABT8Y6R6_9SPHN|nr:head GIN domain-containing protein [Sphingomonas sp. BIUV-7]MDO6414010.1 head GIN domain-containing protein [Sphingomonas sp. BIUV-7]
MRIILGVGLLLAAASGPAAAATRTFPVGGFDRVRSNVPFDVVVRSGAPLGVHAIGKDDLLARLRVSVRNGELVIDAERGRWFQTFTLRKEDRVTINVATPRLSGVALAGPGDMHVNAVRAPAITIALAGPGNLSIDQVEAGRAEVNLSGPGDIQLAGKSGSARIIGRGPGDVRGAQWTVNDVSVDLMGPGDVAVTALRTATVKLMGPGDVRIGGHPRCQVSKMGPGSVRCGS